MTLGFGDVGFVGVAKTCRRVDFYGDVYVTPKLPESIDMVDQERREPCSCLVCFKTVLHTPFNDSPGCIKHINRLVHDVKVTHKYHVSTEQFERVCPRLDRL